MNKIALYTFLVCMLIVSGCSQENLWNIADQPYDSTPPSVINSSVTNGQTGVEVKPVVVLQFDSILLESSVNSANIKLIDNSNTVIDCSRTYSDKKVTVEPTSPLTRGKQYSLKAVNISDLFGNVMSSEASINFETAVQLAQPVISLESQSFLHYSEKLVLQFAEPVITNTNWSVTITGQTNRIVNGTTAGISWGSQKKNLTIPLYLDWTVAGSSTLSSNVVDVTDFYAAADGSSMASGTPHENQLPFSWSSLDWDQTLVTGGQVTPLFIANNSVMRIVSQISSDKLAVNKLNGSSVESERQVDYSGSGPVAGCSSGSGSWLAAGNTTNRLTVYDLENNGLELADPTGVLPLVSVDALALAGVGDQVYIGWIEKTNVASNALSIAVYSNSMWVSVTNITNTTGFRGVEFASRGSDLYGAVWPALGDTKNFLYFIKTGKSYQTNIVPVGISVGAVNILPQGSNDDVLVSCLAADNSQLYVYLNTGGGGATWETDFVSLTGVDKLSGIAYDGTRYLIQAVVDDKMQTLMFDPDTLKISDLPWGIVRNLSTVTRGDLLYRGTNWYSVSGSKAGSDMTYSLYKH